MSKQKNLVGGSREPSAQQMQKKYNIKSSKTMNAGGTKNIISP
jgi:hypothetical protein